MNSKTIGLDNYFCRNKHNKHEILYWWRHIFIFHIFLVKLEIFDKVEGNELFVIRILS